MNAHIEAQLKINLSELIIKSADHINLDPITLLSLAAAKSSQKGISHWDAFPDSEKITIELIVIMIKSLDAMLLDCLFEQVRSQA